MTRQDALEHGTTIACQMESVSNLCCCGCSVVRCIRIGAPTIAADDLRRRTLGHPGRNRLSGPRGQEIHDAVGLKVDEHRPVVVAAPQGKVVHPQHRRRARIGS